MALNFNQAWQPFGRPYPRPNPEAYQRFSEEQMKAPKQKPPKPYTIPSDVVPQAQSDFTNRVTAHFQRIERIRRVRNRAELMQRKLQSRMHSELNGYIDLLMDDRQRELRRSLLASGLTPEAAKDEVARQTAALRYAEQIKGRNMQASMAALGYQPPPPDNPPSGGSGAAAPVDSSSYDWIRGGTADVRMPELTADLTSYMNPTDLLSANGQANQPSNPFPSAAAPVEWPDLDKVQVLHPRSPMADVDRAVEQAELFTTGPEPHAAGLETIRRQMPVAEAAANHSADSEALAQAMNLERVLAEQNRLKNAEDEDAGGGRRGRMTTQDLAASAGGAGGSPGKKATVPSADEIKIMNKTTLRAALAQHGEALGSKATVAELRDRLEAISRGKR